MTWDSSEKAMTTHDYSHGRITSLALAAVITRFPPLSHNVLLPTPIWKLFFFLIFHFDFLKRCSKNSNDYKSRFTYRLVFHYFIIVVGKYFNWIQKIKKYTFKIYFEFWFLAFDQLLFSWISVAYVFLKKNVMPFILVLSKDAHDLSRVGNYWFMLKNRKTH